MCVCGGGGWKWGPRRDIDSDGTKYKLITIGTEPSGTLAYAQGLELHHPNMSTHWGHGGRLYRYSVFARKNEMGEDNYFGGSYFSHAL